MMSPAAADDGITAGAASLPLVLVVEDDTDVREMVCTCLQLGGYESREAACGRDAIELCSRDNFDLAVVDLRLPDVRGFELVQTLSEESGLPVLVLSGLGSAPERAAGIEAGADDYLAKPFEPRELRARVASLLRGRKRAARVHLTQGHCLRVDDRIFDLKRQTARHGHRIHALSSAEFSLLRLLLEHPNEALSRADILAQSDFGPDCGPRSVDIRITRLRKKLETDSGSPRLIHTIRRYGYMLVADRIEHF